MEWSKSTKIGDFSIKDGEYEADNLESSNMLSVYFCSWDFVKQNVLIFLNPTLSFICIIYRVIKNHYLSILCDTTYVSTSSYTFLDFVFL